MSKPDDKQRVDQINQITNGFGQTMLTICEGDWDLALSVSLSLFSSVCAQAAFANDESAEEVFDECGPAARAATLAFETALKREEDADLE